MLPSIAPRVALCRALKGGECACILPPGVERSSFSGRKRVGSIFH